MPVRRHFERIDVDPAVFRSRLPAAEPHAGQQRLEELGTPSPVTAEMEKTVNPRFCSSVVSDSRCRASGIPVLLSATSIGFRQQIFLVGVPSAFTVSKSCGSRPSSPPEASSTCTRTWCAAHGARIPVPIRRPGRAPPISRECPPSRISARLYHPPERRQGSAPAS